MVNTVACLEPDAHQITDFSKLFRTQLYAMFLNTENVPVLLDRNRLLAVLDEALQH